MSRRTIKYILAVVLLATWGHMVFGISGPDRQPPLSADPLMPNPQFDDTTGVNLNAPMSVVTPLGTTSDPSIDGLTLKDDAPQTPEGHTSPDSIPPTGRFLPDSFYETDGDTTVRRGPVRIATPTAETVQAQTPADTAGREGKKFLDDIVSGNNRDSLIYNLRDKKVYIYREGSVSYQSLNLKADYMEVDLESKNVYGHGFTDSLGTKTRPEFTEGGTTYTMDTLAYNLDSKKAKIKGAATKEGDGYLMGEAIKKMADNTVNISKGKYTTCEHIEHPHYYLAMTKAKLIPGKKVIIGYSYLVMEDVPIFFPALPFGFFPITKGRSSGVLMPSFGEEYVKGFFLRDGGYYWAINDYMDLTLKGGYYTLGSWEASAQARYIKKYRYTGGLNFQYAKTIIGEKEDADYVNSASFSLQWTHTQDPKFRPNSTFSASVNLSSSGYTQYGTNSMSEHLATQTSSSISYSKSWPGKPFSLSASLGHSQNSRDTTYMLTLPNVTFNMSRIYPFKSKNFVGKEKWFHKIAMTYTGSFKNDVKVHERELFTEDMFKKMNNGINHSIPVSASFNVLNYINLTPNFSYTERWYFRKFEKEYDPLTNKAAVVDTTYGFYRLYNYNMSVAANTKIYGQFDFTGKNPVIKAVRHVISPNVSFTYTPNFGDPKYGYYKSVQADSTGKIDYYSPWEGSQFGVPGRGESMSISFGLSNTLEAKVRSDKDTSGVRKIKLIDDLSFRGSYNFLADEFNLSVISASLRTTIIQNLGLNLTATFDPYQIDETGKRINEYMVKKGKLARLTDVSTAFGYSFNSGKTGQASMNDINSTPNPSPEEQDFFNRNNIDPAAQRLMMTSKYYDFSIPWNFGFNYSLRYSKQGLTTNVTQTLGFQGSINLTEKWGTSITGGYDFEKGTLSHAGVTITRDLHCWQMNLSWIPIGSMQSWSFNISVKSNVLRDLKYDRRSSRFDTLFDK